MAFASVAVATVDLAEQDSVEPQASKTKCWEEKGEARTRTTHILPSLSKRKDAPLCAQIFAIEIIIVDRSYALLTNYTHCHFKILCAYLRNSA